MEPKKPEFNYDLIRGYCTRFLFKHLHDRHLEDLIQFVAMKFWEKECRANLEWLCLDYLRKNGLGKNAKMGAKTLENSTFVGLSSDESDDVKENNFLLEKFAAENEEPEAIDCQGIVEEFLSDLKLKQETMKWVLRNYRYNPKIK